jgi:hypothetical protein
VANAVDATLIAEAVVGYALEALSPSGAPVRVRVRMA